MAAKSERTRELVLQTALRHLRERGYEATTMRGIAAEAGVSTGNAYYFAGKDELVQELYRRIQQEHRTVAAPRLTPGAPLAENLRTVLHAGLEAMTPYHGLGTGLLTRALSAQRAVSPFSAASGAPRQQAISLMAETLTASRGTPGGALGNRLPQLLWLAYLGVTLHWALDTSPDQQRSRVLVDGLAPLLARTISLVRLPVGRRLSTDVIELLDRLAAPTAPDTTSPTEGRREP
ncbi:TetR family transcriptional regulator [Citricoccus nitrophenolicus]|uniref:TetR family transcriptional regulator n=1 Tax=Citricoccus nitrophenolicus TaxID=863575 RepID=A0ABV0ID74_9MICC